MKKVIFIGDSICYGYGATDLFGWSQRLARKLTAEGWLTEICAVPGERSAHIIFRLQRDVIDKHPDVCFVKLGLANEGLRSAQTPEKREAIRRTFLTNLSFIIGKLHENNIRAVLGGLSIGRDYTPEQIALLHRTQEDMRSLGVPVVEWMDKMTDESGLGRRELLFDQGHPNDEGYRVMYDCIPENIMELAR